MLIFIFKPGASHLGERGDGSVFTNAIKSAAKYMMNALSVDMEI